MLAMLLAVLPPRVRCSGGMWLGTLARSLGMRRRGGGTEEGVGRWARARGGGSAEGGGGPDGGRAGRGLRSEPTGERRCLEADGGG